MDVLSYGGKAAQTPFHEIGRLCHSNIGCDSCRETRDTGRMLKIEDCSKGGLRVRPAKGSAILFYSIRPDGEKDMNSFHGACPPGAGETKWAANE